MTDLASVHFKYVDNIAFEASHAYRTELSEPSYLLPEEDRLGNFAVEGSLTETELVEVYSLSLGKLSGAAKARKSSPFWHGVMILRDIKVGESVADYKKSLEKDLIKWRAGFNNKTKTKVKAIIVHLDEGHYHPESGMAKYNAHAHIFVDRVIEEKVILWGKERLRNRIYSPGRKEISEIQDLTSELMGMKRGLSLSDRGGRRGRKHIPSGAYRELKQLEEVHALEMAQTKKQLEESLLREKYNLIRGFMKGQKNVSSKDHSTLKSIKEDNELISKIADLIEKDVLKIEDLLHMLRTQRWQELDELVLLRPELSVTNAIGEVAGEGRADHLQAGYTYQPLKRWSVDDRDLYLLPERSNGKRLAFEDCGDRISVKIASDDVLKRVLHLAARKWPEGITIHGSDEFVRRAWQMCIDMDIQVLSVNRTISPGAERSSY